MDTHSFGYAGRILRINLTSRSFIAEPLSEDEARRWIGGRGLNVSKLFYEVPPDTDPLSPENPFIAGVGPLNGTSFPGAGRINFTARSPHTGILGDSNAGTAFSAELKYAGYDQIIITGACEKWTLVVITEKDVRFEDAEDMAGLDTIETQKTARMRLRDPGARVAAIGPASENGVTFSGIFLSGSRAAARSGMGLVLASKKIKAIAVRGRLPLTVADPEKFRKRICELTEKIRRHPQYESRRQMGTTFLLSALNNMGCLSTRHFQSGTFEAAADVCGEKLAETVKFKSRGCFSCTIPCSRVWKIETQDGVHIGEGPEFEGLAGFSSRVGCKSLDFSLLMCDRCNRLGLDVITTSEVISFAMELSERGELSRSEADGLDLKWGNQKTVEVLIEKISRREGFGDLLASGVREAARRLGRGDDIAMHVKGLEIFQADPRGIKGYALGLSVASRGGDHLRSEPSFEFSGDSEAGLRIYGSAEAAQRLGVHGKGRVVKDFEERSALADCLNVCKNTLVNMEILDFGEAADLLRLATGMDFEGEELRTSCERVVNLERLYLNRLGVGRKDDTLPSRFLHEPMPGGGATAGNVVELEPMLDEYYKARGWDIATGRPEPETLLRLGLNGVSAGAEGGLAAQHDPA
jgi:aldehyde:ferredoxin oxidoreductase